MTNQNNDLYDTVGHNHETKLHEMVSLGKEYREDMELEVFGGTVTIEHRPLPDKEFLPLMSDMAEAIDLDVTDSEEALDEAFEEVDEARDEEGNIDIRELNDEFIEITHDAAALGITASYDENGQRVEIGEEEAHELLEDMVGGISVEIGMQVLDKSGNVRDAELFR